MTVECRPPEGTPDGTICVLENKIQGADLPGKRSFAAAIWADEYWFFGDGWICETSNAHAQGWVFSRLAEVPHA